MDKLPRIDIENGLSGGEAKRLLGVVGPNALEAKREFSVVGLLVSQFMSPLIYVLGIAGVATVYLKEWVDAVVILAVVLVNTTLGFWQEFKAARSLEALKEYLKPKVRVVRDGRRVVEEAVSLVPGDVVLLDHGESVPADGVVVEAEELLANEAMLTGESVSVVKAGLSMNGWSREDVEEWWKKEGNNSKRVFMGTMVAGGFGKMVVVETGAKTEMGKIAEKLVATEEEDTPLQRKLAGLARSLMWVVVVVTILILVLGLLRGGDLVEMFETAIAIAVAAVPEGLAVSMTVILALGMQRILRRKALVRKLVAAETLGSVSVICCDKTGTLTEGKMKIVDYVGDRDELLRGAILANNQRDEEGMAMYEWARVELLKKRVSWTGSTNIGQIKLFYKRLDGIAFSSVHKYAASLNQSKSKQVLVMVGAPEMVMGRCYMSARKRKEEMTKIRELAREGHRLIGVASKNLNTKNQRPKIRERDLENLGWQGLLVFEDPVRSNVAKALMAARAAGVKVKVITGDYKETAVAVLKRVLGDDLAEKQVITGEEMASLTRRELERRIGEVVLFARTTPQQKLMIVEALRKKGEVVAMTGDGVNDAPALKAADIGVVVNEATDVSKQTADMVLLDSNFGTIVAAIQEGRVIYETMRKVVAYLLTDAFQELILIGGSLVLNLPLPLTAVQILWINLVEDGLPGVALAFDSSDAGVMEDKPRRREAPIIDRELKELLVLVGGLSNLMLLGLYMYLQRKGLSVEHLRTFMFAAVGTNSLLYIFSIKSLRTNIWHQKLLDNTYLLVAVGVGLIVMTASLYVPALQKLLGTEALGGTDLMLILGLSVVTIVMIEGVKMLDIWNKNRNVGEGRR